MSGEEYRRAMDTLARETVMPPESAARIERQLLDAFASGDAAEVVPSPGPKSVVWRPWVPAAAAIVLIAGAAFLAWTNRQSSAIIREYVSAAAEKALPAPENANVVTPAGFVDLPWTAGLPAFESGEIVRMDLPVASLPTYGIDISSGAGKGPVEADILIGQDGFARAIRLVTTTSRSTQ